MKTSVCSIFLFLIYSYGALEVKAESLESEFPQLALGIVGLPQEVTVEELSSGLTYFEVIRGESSRFDRYQLTSGSVSIERAEELSSQLADLGHLTRIEPLSEFGLYGESLGVQLVLESDEKPSILLKSLEQHNMNLVVRHSAENGNPTTGPFRLSVLRVDLDEFSGRIKSTLAKGQVRGVEPVSLLAKRHGAVAAINGGFFSWKEQVGTIGDLAGIAVIDGRLVSESVQGRPALLIQNDLVGKLSPKVRIIHNLRTQLWIESGGQRLDINGMNRKPGKVLNCGNDSAQPIIKPAHDFVCTNNDELILFNEHFGRTTPSGVGQEFSINKEGAVISISSDFGRVIESGYVVFQATGKKLDELQGLIKLGARIRVGNQILSDEGEIKLRGGMYIVNGGPTLLRAGQPSLQDRAKEGWETHFESHGVSNKFLDKEDAIKTEVGRTEDRNGFYHGWVVRRHPRTAVGITSDNILYAVVIYGRQPTVSAGASLSELSYLLSSLGVQEAINLDGGGSSMMVINGKPTGSSSDASGERGVGDAILFFPSLSLDLGITQ